MIKIEAIPAFSDNYIWCLYDEQSREAVVVDPGEAAPVKTMLKEHQLALSAILLTHHHFDHVGGVDELLSETHVPVFGPVNNRVPQITHALGNNDTVNILNTTFDVITIPGHTLDHIAFYSADSLPQPTLFCGDTLFAGGCGRIFEGNPEMMLDSLSKIAQLPPNTLFYCAHEYTLANLKFALAVEPTNEHLKQRIIKDTQSREQGLATVPSTLTIEKETNPFLRCEEPSVINAANQHCNVKTTNSLDVFAAIRQWKDNF